MPLIKPPNNKRVKMPRSADFERGFIKDWDRLSRTGRFNMRQLKEAMILLIANHEPLSAEWLDHPLKGEWSNHREFHIGGDFLLVYQADENTVLFVRCGTHSELFD
jgi:mRNA interferase YafQ